MAGRRVGSLVNQGVPLRPDLLAGYPPAFQAYYRDVFRNPRSIYGHWSRGGYAQAPATSHREVAVTHPTDLDAALEKYLEARNRRVGGAIPALAERLEDLKRQAIIRVLGETPYTQDLTGHTRGRDENSVALTILGAREARPNDLGPAAPLPLQIRALATLIAEACEATGAPVTGFLTASEAADNCDFPTPDDTRAPHPPHGFRTTRETWDLEAWIELPHLTLFAPRLTPRAGWVRLGDWLRETALGELADRTRAVWDADTSARAIPRLNRLDDGTF